MPIRLGLTIDPQPMESPRSSYTYLSFGTGLRFTRLAVDAALRFGRERGSGNNLSAFEAALTLRYFLTADE